MSQLAISRLPLNRFWRGWQFQNKQFKYFIWMLCKLLDILLLSLNFEPMSLSDAEWNRTVPPIAGLSDWSIPNHFVCQLYCSLLCGSWQIIYHFKEKNYFRRMPLACSTEICGIYLWLARADLQTSDLISKFAYSDRSVACFVVYCCQIVQDGLIWRE